MDRLHRTQLPTDIGTLSGFRNQVINGNFDIWQRGTSFAVTIGYSADRWTAQTGTTGSISQQSFSPGQTEVPGNPTYFLRFAKTGTADYGLLVQMIEGVQTLAGKTATLTFYGKADVAAAGSVLFLQVFGSGGSTNVSSTSYNYSLTTTWQKFSILVSIPSIAGKTIGTNGCVHIRFTPWGTTSSTIGTFDIAHVSLVEGDATKEADPFSPRHIGQEYELCYRYYEIVNHTAGIGGLSPTTTSSAVKFAVRKRVAPTVTRTSNYGSSAEAGTVASLATVNEFYITNTAASVGGTFTIDAEL